MISNAALNACLNGLSGVLLACGYAAIRAGKKGLHKAFMLSAVSVSSLFLISYLTYHIRVGKAVLFQGQGWIRPAYFTLLTSHTILRSEEHTSELQSRLHLVCRLLLEKKKNNGQVSIVLL